jgi:hypothetical protein
MELQILDVKQDVSKKTGEVKKNLIALGTFSNYGNVEPATVKISLNDEQFEKLLPYKGKKVDLDVVVPLPTFPLTLNSLNL